MRSEIPAGLLCALLLPLAPARGEVVERILAVVDGRPLLLSEVRLLERVKGLDRDAALEQLIDQRLMFREAARLPQAAVTDEDEERAYASLKERIPAGAEFPAEADLRRLARREAAILKYVEFRFRPQVRVDDEAVRAAWEASGGERDGAPSFEEAAPGIRRELAEKEMNARIEAWIAELRAAADLRYNLEGPS